MEIERVDLLNSYSEPGVTLRNMRLVRRSSLSREDIGIQWKDLNTDIIETNLLHHRYPCLQLFDQEGLEEIFWSPLQKVNIITRPGLHNFTVCNDSFFEEEISNSVSYEEEFSIYSQVMQQYSDDIEMWDFEQILDKSPLTSLTADFARFKQRFANIFSNSSNNSSGGVPYIDSDSSESINTVAAGQSLRSTTVLPLDSNKTSMNNTNCNGSSHYLPRKTSSNSNVVSSDNTKHCSNSLQHGKDNSKSTPTNKKEYDSCISKSQHDTESETARSAPSTVPAKRPTDLPVIPHIITDEYITRMKTKGYTSSTLPKDMGRYKHQRTQANEPRLTHSYLEEHNKSRERTHNSRCPHSLEQNYQFNKYQQEVKLKDNYYHNNATRSKEKSMQRPSGVRFCEMDSPIDRDSEEDSYISTFKGAVGSNAHHSQDNRLLKEDIWRGPPTPHPNKAGTSVGATHRGTHRFTPRHSDELNIEIGDSIHVLHEADDGWCMGINLTSQNQGIFPSVYATDLEFYEVDGATTVKQPHPKLYKLHFLGSVEVSHHKGSRVLVDAIEKIILNRRLSKDTTTPPLCQLQVSEAGIKMIDLTHKKRTHKLVTDLNIESACERLSKLLAFSKETKAVSNHFFSLKNVSFCGYHPDNPRYFGFITKHPTQRRFACHCYSSIDDSTQPIVDAVGDAFHNYYCEFVPFSHSSEELYME